MRFLTSAFVLSAILAASPVLAQQASISHQDREFAKEAMAANMAEIEMGKLAQQHSTNPSVRDFGQKMVTDHSQNSQQITTLARTLGIAPLSKIPAEEQRKVDEVAHLQGEAFDTAYTPMMVQDHKADIESFNKEIRDGANGELKDYARQTLPMLEQHLSLAEDISRPQGAAVEPQKR